MIVEVSVLFWLFHFFLFKSRLRKSFFFWFLLFVVLVFLAVTRPSTMLDYQDYLVAFENGYTRMEPTFLYLSQLINIHLGDFIFLLIVYALLGISLKLYAIKKYSEFFGLSILFYLSNIYILHDLIQIRVSIVSGILLCALGDLIDKRKRYFLLISIASLFHFSAIILFLLWFINSCKISKVWFFILFISYLFFFLGIQVSHFLFFIPIDSLRKTFLAYQEIMNNGVMDNLNVFNVVHLLKCFLALILLYNIDKLQIKYRYSILLIKVYLLSLSLYVLLSDIPVFAVRISELLAIVEIFLLPLIVFIFTPRKFAVLITILIANIFFLMNVFYVNLLTAR